MISEEKEKEYLKNQTHNNQFHFLAIMKTNLTLIINNKIIFLCRNKINDFKVWMKKMCTNLNIIANYII